SLLWSDSAARYIPARTAASRHKAGISDVRCEVSSCPAAARRYGPPRAGGHTEGIAMRKRIGLLGLLGVLAGTGPVLAEKPSGLPADVRPDGTEPTPVARELNVAAGPAAQEEKPAVGSLAEMVAVVREWVLSYRIVQLGTVPVRE